MTKPGTARPVVIPMRKGLKEDIVMTVVRAIGMTRSDLEEAHSTMKCNRGRGALGVRPAVSRQAEGRGECRVARGA